MKTNLRRNQLIAPFGVGALHVLKGSRAVVTGGLDFWFRNATHEQIRCVRVQEPRLQTRLGVSHFRLPPGPETELPDAPPQMIPLFRFPTWFVCPRCHQMDSRNLGAEGEVACKNPKCEEETMSQIRFAAVCDHGHLQDFPWREWVHRDKNPSCHEKLTYHAGGNGSLADIQIRCSCKKSRSLEGIMSGDMPNHATKKKGWSFLTSALTSDKGKKVDANSAKHSDPFHCQGGRPWLGEPLGEECNRPLRAILINATNVHYAYLHSALWIPDGGVEGELGRLKQELDKPEIRMKIQLARTLDMPASLIANAIVKRWPEKLAAFDPNLILEALDGGGVDNQELPDGLNEEETLRYPEYLKLQEHRSPKTSDDFLEVRIADVKQLPQNLQQCVESVSLVDKLRETRVMNGFTRLVPLAAPDAPRPSVHLWKNPPVADTDKWLPAALVFGEGIFIRFAEKPLQEWEDKELVKKHICALQHREDSAARRIGREARTITPRFVLLHTLAHLLMRRLAFECGYGSASLRERLYVATKPQLQMAGILIYTASGDCEGSMGGLVRMGEPAHFGRIFAAAIEDARWCSSDPVCTESGTNGGQGMDGLNMAACHCCTLIPETSCEHFNSLLDRSLVVSGNLSGNIAFFE